MDINDLIINGCNCFNCKHSHLFNNKLKCRLNTKGNNNSNSNYVKEDDVKICWEE